MNRRDAIKTTIAGVVGSLFVGSKVKAKSIDRVEEERTREYLSNLSEWNPKELFDDEKNLTKEYLFTYKKSILDTSGVVVDHALVYSPRHLVPRGHFFDLIWVKIGKQNLTKILPLWSKRKKGPNGGFLKLEDI